MTTQISAARRKTLCAAAHRLKPAVTVGKGGLTEPLLEEIRRSLQAQGLIKIRFTVKDGPQIDALSAEIVRRLGCACLGRTGFVAAFFDAAAETMDDNPPDSA